MNFQQLDLPIYNLQTELNLMILNKILSWGDLNQICINSIAGKEDNYLYGSGSLFYDWASGKKVVDKHGNRKLVNGPRREPLKESDFTVICNIFKDTIFEEAYNIITRNYNVGRVRLMKSPPKTCLSWHVDDTKRIHYPIKTQEGCFMLIEDEVKHLPQYTWWLTNTLVKHTALNASLEDRIHLVATLLD